MVELVKHKKDTHAVAIVVVVQVNNAPTTNVFARRKISVVQVIIRHVVKADHLSIKSVAQIHKEEMVTVIKILMIYMNAVQVDKYVLKS